MRRWLRFAPLAGAVLALGLLGAGPAAAQQGPDHLHVDLSLVGCGTLQASAFKLPPSTELDLRFANAASGATLHQALTGIARLTARAGASYESAEHGIAASFGLAASASSTVCIPHSVSQRWSSVRTRTMLGRSARGSVPADFATSPPPRIPKKRTSSAAKPAGRCGRKLPA